MAKSRKTQIEDLRTLLFNTLERLLDQSDPMDSAQAKAIANVGRVVVESAKIEIEFMKTFGGRESGFIPIKQTHKDRDLLN